MHAFGTLCLLWGADTCSRLYLGAGSIAAAVQDEQGDTRLALVLEIILPNTQTLAARQGEHVTHMLLAPVSCLAPGCRHCVVHNAGVCTRTLPPLQLRPAGCSLDDCRHGLTGHGAFPPLPLLLLIGVDCQTILANTPTHNLSMQPPR